MKAAGRRWVAAVGAAVFVAAGAALAVFSARGGPAATRLSAEQREPKTSANPAEAPAAAAEPDRSVAAPAPSVAVAPSASPATTTSASSALAELRAPKPPSQPARRKSVPARSPERPRDTAERPSSAPGGLIDKPPF